MAKIAKNGIVHARLNAELKANVESILERIGLTSSDAVSLFFKQIELNGGLPFELKIPRYNAETVAAIDEARRISKDKSVPAYSDMESLKKAIER